MIKLHSNCRFCENTGEPCDSCDDFSKWEPKPGTFIEVPKGSGVLLNTAEEPIGSASTSTHYQVGSKQPIEIMQEVMTPEAFQGFCRGNVIKYALRLGHKDDPLKEAAKIEQYAKWLRESLEGKQIDPRK